MKKIQIATGLTIVLLVLACWALLVEKRPVSMSPTTNPTTNDLIFYYGDGCPHCANVEKYFVDQGIEERIKFTRKEVYNNQVNQNELLDRAVACGLDKNNVGIPLLWHDGQCLIGDVDIIKFFEAEINK